MLQNTPRISVIIPTYNRAPQVPAAVRSALEQRCQPCEVIVVDDGSTDATVDALGPFTDWIRYIKTENRGVSAARNRGIREATGEWIAFLDSDDTWHPDKLRKQMECMARAGSKVCFCVSADESGDAIDDLRSMDPGLEDGGERFYPPEDCRMFRFPRHPFLQSMVADREALVKVGAFDESLKVAEDTKLIHRLILAHGYSVVNEILVGICRDREGPGLSDTMDPESAFKRFDCYIRVQAEAWWRLVPLDSAAAAEVRSNLAYFVSRQAEIACALGWKDVSRRYAAEGLRLRGDVKTIVRNLLLVGAYPAVAGRFVAKWRK